MQINMELKTSAKNTINIEDLFISTAKQLLSKQTNNPIGEKGSQSGKTGIDLMNNNEQENANLFKNNNLI